MPKRTDIHKILIIGSGPIVIGQACEFDYSGTQACKALRQEGYEIVLVNSNPATIMTDPETATHRSFRYGNNSSRTSGCAAADCWWADRAESRDCARRRRRTA
jgi:hypothetical protein